MSQRSIRERVLDTIRGVLGNPNLLLTDDTSITEELAKDSLTQMAIFVALEDEFQRTIPQEEVSDIRTLGQIVTYIKKKLAE